MNESKMNESKMNESKMQAILMDYVMEKKRHQFAIPNLTSLYRWEADLISATRAWFVHEFEIKISKSDFVADSKKIWKHLQLKTDYKGWRSPNYFWYAINGFTVEVEDVPEYAGLLQIKWHENFKRYDVTVIKSAPRLHLKKMTEKERMNVNRWLGYKLKNMYLSKFSIKCVSVNYV